MRPPPTPFLHTSTSWIYSFNVTIHCTKGKTLQTAAFIHLLVEKMYQPGPFLICVPLSTLVHWQREFISWTGLNTIVYHGSAEDRKKIREHEFAFEKDRPDNPGWGVNSLYLKKCEPAKKGSAGYTQWMASVVITTPEMLVADDWTELSYVKWSVLVVDEVCYYTILHYYLLLILLSCFAFTFYCTRHRLLNHIPSYSNTNRFFISSLSYTVPSYYTVPSLHPYAFRLVDRSMRLPLLPAYLHVMDSFI